MKCRLSRLVLTCAVSLLLFQKSAVAQTTNDLWDISGGTVITTNSGASAGPLENMFGGNFASPEPGIAFFRDDQSAGFVHFVEWKTPGFIKLTGFHLLASDDGAANGGRRGFSEFRLYARDPFTQTFQLIDSYTPTNPYPSEGVDLVRGVTPVIAQEFRAEFVQFFSGSFPGPRIIELDGLGESAACLPPPQSILSWWRAESNFLDSISTNHGAPSGEPTFVPGLVGTAYQFDGTNDIVYVPSAGFKSVTNSFTMEMWVYPTGGRGSVTESTNGGSGVSAGQRYAIFPAHGDQFGGGSHAGAGISIGTNGVIVFEHAAFYLPGLLVYDAPITGWTHVAVVYSNAQPSLYINGAFVRTGLQSTKIVHPSADQGGGAYGCFAGLMDEYTIYYRALNPSEIAAIYNAGSSGKCVPECTFTYLGAVFPGRTVRVATVSTNKVGGCSNGQQNDFATSPAFQTLRGALLDAARFGSSGTVNRSIEILPPVSLITDESIKSADVIFLQGSDYSSEEKDVLRRFVNCGGGIFAFDNNAAVTLSNVVAATPGSFTGSAQATITTTNSPITSGPFGNAALNATLPTGLSGSFLPGELGANGAGFLSNDAGIIGATFIIGAGRVAVFCDEELFMNSPSVSGCYAAQLGSISTTLFLNSVAFVMPQVDETQPLQLTPSETNIIVGQSLSFTGSGGIPPLFYSFATNQSGGSINSTFGAYVAGPVANVTDTIRVTDARGSNVTVTVHVLPDPTPRADLAIESINSPANLEPGVPFNLVWVVTNRGSAIASAPWKERAFVSGDALAGNDSFLGEFSVAAPLNAGESITRTQLVTIPIDGDAGLLHFVVATDSGAVVNEGNETNNVGVSASASQNSFLLTLNPSAITLPEGQTANVTITRNGSRAAPLSVNLFSSDATELSVPANVTIPGGAASATFSVQTLSDGLFDGEQSVTLTASANGFPDRTAGVFVSDTDVPRLFLSLSTNQALEGSTIEAVVSRELVTTSSLAVTLAGGQGQLAFPNFVTIPANSNSVSFQVIALGDTLIEPTNTYSLTASSAGFQNATANISIEDDDLPNVAITLALHTVGEDAGANATTAVATRDRNSPRAVSIALASSNTNLVRVPALVTIPASQTNVSFPIAVLNNTDVDGTRNVTIGGTILSSVGNLPLRAAQPDTLTVTDDDGPALKLTLARELVGEGLNPATTGTISRNTGSSGELVVNLNSSNTNEATVPLSVAIPDGSNSVSFPIASLNDGTNDGNRSVIIDAASAGFAPASAPLVVSDIDLPDLVVANVTSPTNAVTGQQLGVTFRIENQGLSTAGTNFLQRILLSTDPQAGDDTIVAQASFSGSIPVGQFFEQTLNVFLPQTPGDYWLVVTADANNQVVEGLENNNTRVTTLPITVAKAYSATVSANPKTAPAGTPILLSGHATRSSDGQPAAFEIVSVHLTVRGTERVLSALTDANGNYALTFQPLPGEAGVYSIAADHPGIAKPSAQDSFTLLGLRVPEQPTLKLVEGASGTNTTFVENLSDLPLTGLSAEVLSAPTNVTLEVQFGATTLAGNGTTSLQLIVHSQPGSAGGGVFRVRVLSSEGATGEFDLPVVVESLVPRLVVTPASLSAGMRRGSQTSVELSVTNNGGAPSGALNILLPALPWISISSGAQIPSLAPGEGALITLLLTPPADLPLGDHTGSLAINATNTGVTVPFKFRSLSDNTGLLKISAVDELTFYAEGSPKLTNATVRLSIPETGEIVLATNFNGLDELLLTNIVEAYYTLRVDAPNHDPYQDTFLIKPAQTNEVIAFLSRQSVRYTWTVTPVQIEDRYEITVDTTFETAVPIPVVTVEPSVIDVTDFPGETKQVDLKITNHGLLAAQGARLSFDAHPNLAITPLIGEIGVLPAQSSLTIPVTLRKLSVAPAADRKPQAAGDENGGGDCSLGGKLEWKINCAGQEITHVVPLKAVNLNQIGVQCGTSAQAFFVSGGLPGGFNFAALGAGLGNPGYTAPISFAEKSVCDPCFQNVGGNLLQNCLPLLPVPLFESPDNDECESGSGTAEQLVACFQDALDDLKDKVSEPLDKAGELGDALGDDGEDVKDATDGAKNGLDRVGGALDVLRCLSPLLDPCITGVGGAADIRPGAVAAADANHSITAPLVQRLNQVLAFVGGHTNLFGSDVWFRGTNIVAWTNWINAFTARMNVGTEANSKISSTERAELLAMPFPEPVVSNDVTRLIDRWNRTVDYFNAGVFNRTNVPSGQSLDFIALDERREILAAARAAQAEAESQGFADVAHAYNFTRRELIDRIFAQSDGVCAKIRLRLEQQAVISRDAFKATLEIENHTGTSLENIGVTLLVTDENGNDRTALFQIRPPVLDGISGVDGTGIQPASTTGSSSWLLVPSSLAAPTNRARYFVSGTLTYRQDGSTLTIPLAPTAIDVLPNPKLVLDYFHERDVFSDDPFTPEIEPAIPYSLAVRVRNEGFGSANNFRITSAQPKIVENEKGLLINFEIVATEVAGVGLTPALTANFGNIAPGSSIVGRWLFRSSLQGLFTDYNATFEHVSGLGDRRLSLIDSVNIHEMIHLVQAGGAFEDGEPDFLVNDVPDLDDLPDTLFFSNGSNAPVNIVLNATNDAPVSPGHLTVHLNTTMPNGWTYLRVPDPADANYRLLEVRRADNSVVNLERNVWRTDRTFIGFGHRPLRENILHLLDFNSSGSYTLVYEPVLLSADTNAPSSAVSALSSASPATFQVNWSGNDGANGSGVAYFDIFVSANGGAFTNWLARTSGTGAIFQAVPGVTYAFYSRATDSAGNVEAAPASADAETSTSIINHPPVLEILPDITLNEGETVSLTPTASDLDGNTLTFLFGATVPSGIVLNSQSGKITWITGESHGPSTNEIQLIARDDGVPFLSATQTFFITVLESNTPPALTAIPNFTNSENTLLTFTNFASDSDLPLQRLSFNLGSGAPEGASVDPTNGVFAWRPTEIQGGTTNLISVIVTDDGPSSLSATQTFSVVVLDTQPDFRIAIGTTAVLSGASGSVPLQLHSGVDLTNVHLVLAVRGERLTNFSFSALAPQVVSANFSALGSNRFDVSFEGNPGAPLQGDFALAHLGFATVSNEHSTIIHLSGESLVGSRATPSPTLDGAAANGRVFIVGAEPILDAAMTNQQLALTLYALPGEIYGLESRAAFDPASQWIFDSSTAAADLRTELPLRPAENSMKFFRAYRVAQMELTVDVQQGQILIEWPMDCVGCVLEETDDFKVGATWTQSTVQPEIAGDRYRVLLNSTSAQRFYRLRKPQP